MLKVKESEVLATKEVILIINDSLPFSRTKVSLQLNETNTVENVPLVPL